MEEYSGLSHVNQAFISTGQLRILRDLLDKENANHAQLWYALDLLDSGCASFLAAHGGRVQIRMEIEFVTTSLLGELNKKAVVKQ